MVDGKSENFGGFAVLRHLMIDPLILALPLSP